MSAPTYQFADFEKYIITTADEFNQLRKKFTETATINNQKFIGFDLEFKTHKYPVTAPWIASDVPQKIISCKLLLASSSMCLIIDLCKIGKTLPNKLIEIITSSGWIKCGVEIGNDLKYLSENYNLGQCNGGFDVKPIFGFHNCSSPSLVNIYNALNKGNEKKDKDNLPDWAGEMTEEMIEYAYKDAFMSYVVGASVFGMLKTPLFNAIEIINLNNERAKPAPVIQPTPSVVEKVILPPNPWNDCTVENVTSVDVVNQISPNSIVTTSVNAALQQKQSIECPVALLHHYSQRGLIQLEYTEEHLGKTEYIVTCIVDDKYSVQVTQVGKRRQKVAEKMLLKLRSMPDVYGDL